MGLRLGVAIAVVSAAGACTISIGEVVVRVSDAGAGEAAPTCPPGAAFRSDPANCGACGHDCLGGVCDDAACQPAVFVDDGGAITVAVDGTYVYWSTISGEIMLCEKRGTCIPAEFAMAFGTAFDMAVDDAGVYWTTSYAASVVSCPKPNCVTPAVLYRGTTETQSIAVDDRYVYWINQSTDGPDAAAGSVMRCGKWDCDGGPLVLASGQIGPSGIAIDDTNAYWLVNGPPTSGALMRCNKDGCDGSPTTIVDNQSTGYVAVDDASVYWTQDYDLPALSTCAKEGPCYPSTLADTPASPTWITLDESRIYWVASPADGGLVLSCAKPDCAGGLQPLASGLNQPGGIAVDDQAVYFTDFGTGTVLRVAKAL